MNEKASDILRQLHCDLAAQVEDSNHDVQGREAAAIRVVDQVRKLFEANKFFSVHHDRGVVSIGIDVASIPTPLAGIRASGAMVQTQKSYKGANSDWGTLALDYDPIEKVFIEGDDAALAALDKIFRDRFELSARAED